MAKSEASGPVERVLAALGIRVVEARRGELVARCPYHSPDNHPSWSIKATGTKRGLHNCLSCKGGGNLESLVRHKLGLDRDGAREWLEELLVAEEEPAPPLPVAVTVEVTGDAAPRPFRLPPEVVVDRPLAEWPTPARAYAESRGITPWQVSLWGIGYAVYGRLGGRIVVPIRTPGGRLASYVARAFDGGGPRYLYPRADEGADREVMFGERRWPLEELRGFSDLVVTEGAIDALAVQRAAMIPQRDPGAMSPVVAALGGSRPTEHTLLRLSVGWGMVTVMTDSDPPGESAAEYLFRGLERHIPRVRRVALGPGNDACSVGVEELRHALGWRG